MARLLHRFPSKRTCLPQWLRSDLLCLPADALTKPEPLHVLDQLTVDVKLLALGEATHGNREFTYIRDGLVRALASRERCAAVVMELPAEAVVPLDQFARTGDGDPSLLVATLPYWTLRTQETLVFLRWLRQHNQGARRRPIRLFGCDVSPDDRCRRAGSMRDAAMAAACARIQQQLGRDAITVLWSHNSHIADVRLPAYTSTVAVLRRRLGRDVLTVGFLCGRGRFLAVGCGSSRSRLQAFRLPPPRPSSFEALFSDLRLPPAFLDLRPLRRDRRVVDWRTGRLSLRDVGATFDQAAAVDYSQPADLPTLFDLVCWLPQVTPATLLTA